MRQMLLQNATAVLLQNATEVCYKMRQFFYYKMRQLLQNSTFITNWDSTAVDSCSERSSENSDIIFESYEVAPIKRQVTR